ncbi:MAG: hypothetical protein DIU61_013585 [Bacteroidota bacterium]|nr:MAG: hypothetical protein DIU61_15140 [Bacteroidota bacterium]
MIPLLPHATRTLVTILQQEEVFERMRRGITPDKNRFAGVVQPDRFSISMRVRRPATFLPLIRGHTEPTPSGCLIFLKAALFPSTRVYMVFWLLFVPVAGVIAARQYDSPWPLAVALIADLAVLWIAWANFRIQLRLSMEALDAVLNSAD